LVGGDGRASSCKPIATRLNTNKQIHHLGKDATTKVRSNILSLNRKTNLTWPSPKLLPLHVRADDQLQLELSLFRLVPFVGVAVLAVKSGLSGELLFL